jgi:hypothetical protein
MGREHVLVKGDTDVHHLSPEWKRHLADIQGFQLERDVWFDWLCQHLPEMRRVIKKDAVESNEWLGKSVAEVRGSIMRSSAAGFK